MAQHQLLLPPAMFNIPTTTNGRLPTRPLLTGMGYCSHPAPAVTQLILAALVEVAPRITFSLLKMILLVPFWFRLILMEVRRDKDKNVFAKSSAVEGVYKANADLADGVDKGVDDFRNKKVFDFGFSDPSRVEVKGTGYTKAGDKWTANGKTM